MSLTIEFLGHSGFILTDGTHVLVIDPYLSGNPVAVKTPESITCDYIALTHGHSDHIGDTVAIATRNNATVVASFEIANMMSDSGVKKIEPINHGGRIATAFGWIAFTHAFHSSSYQGTYMGMPCGIVARIGGKTFYHCGDTGLFGDMALIGEIYKPDVAAIPIGDRFTMGAELGTRAAEMIGAPIAIPIHYKTFDLLAQTAEGFSPSGITVKELAPGESVSLP